MNSSINASGVSAIEVLLSCCLIFACIAASRSGNSGCVTRPELRLELAVERSLVVVDGGHRRDRRLRPAHELARAPPRPAPASSRAVVEQRVVVDAAPHEPDPLGFRSVEHLAEQHGRGRRPAGRRCGGASRCARRRGGGRAAGSGCRSGPTRRPGARRRPAPGSCPRRPPAPLTAAMVGSGERATRRKPS